MVFRYLKISSYKELIMKRKTKPSPGAANRGTQQTSAYTVHSPFIGNPYAGKPLDGSQYVDVVEEQEYADRRPTPEEQKPRFAFEPEPKSSPGK